MNKKLKKKLRQQMERRYKKRGGSVISSKWDPNLRYPLPPSGNKGKSVHTLGSIWKG